MSPPLHYAGQNLRGRNFKGQDLTGANFSNADIRGANFTRAILQLIFLILARQGFTAKTSRTMALGLAIGVFGSGLLTGSLIPGAISFLPQG